MLRLSLPTIEIYNDETEEFEFIGGKTIELEHSLYTVASWESKWKIPFALKKGLTREQLIDYITNFMCQTEDIAKEDWTTLTEEIITKISDYMEDPHSATTINHGGLNKPRSSRQETVTSEILYFYMANFGIPFECEHWHLNRLMKLIDVCAIKNSPPRKMGKKEAAEMQAKQNAAMRAKLGSKG